MNEATLEFINRNADADVRQLALRGSKDPEVDLTIALQQIQGRQTARKKIPTWAAIDGVVYPVHLSMEQCSSEQTARYKADLCRRLITSHLSPLIDLTGGFGVDFFFMSEAFDEAVYVERNAELCAIASHNFKVLGKSVACVNADGADYLHQLSHAALIFLDPARRDSHGDRTYGISDCTPDVLSLKEELLEKSDVVMLKLSPMLDWRKAVDDLGEAYVSEVHIVSVQNECKELLIVMQKDAPSLRLVCVNDDNIWEPYPSPLSSQFSVLSFHFLYEPNASVMKSGCFTELECDFGVAQLAPNSHLFLSDRLIANFPGRQFRIVTMTSMNKQELKSALKDIRQANLAVRNFPLSVAELRKKLKLADGGSTYIFATTKADGQHFLLICDKVSQK